MNRIVITYLYYLQEKLMNGDGFNMLKEALGGFNVEIVPEPSPEEDVPYVTIVGSERLVGSKVLNALDVAGLGENRELTDRYTDDPELKFVSQTETTMTFLDTKARI
jgi:hypothetical protein